MAFPWLGMILQALPTFPEDVHPYGDLYDRVMIVWPVARA